MNYRNTQLLAFLIESKGCFRIVQGGIHGILYARQVAFLHIFQCQRIFFEARDTEIDAVAGNFDYPLFVQGTGGYQASHVCACYDNINLMIHFTKRLEAVYFCVACTIALITVS